MGALIGLGLIALLVACAASPQDSENLGSTSSPLVFSGLFPTGVDATGTPLAVGVTDSHYVLTSDDPMRPGPNALVVAPATGWIANTTTSNWISAQANAMGANGANYTYTTTFTLAGVDPTLVAINGLWACADSCVLSLNGTVVASYAAPAWTAVAAFTIPEGSPFVRGTNALVFVTANSDGGATGLQVISMSGRASGCTADDQCSIAEFCNTQTRTCVGTLRSGTPIPTITGHTPVLDGVCASGVGESVCEAGVCDMSNNECGLANGDGPCTMSNGAIVCQSGACSVNDTCEPQGADASGGTDGSLDGAVGSDGSQGEDGSAVAESSMDASVVADGQAGTDGSAKDASEEDATVRARQDAGEEGADSGLSPNKVLEGDGLSCSATRPGSRGSSGFPIWVPGVAVAAAMRRRWRDRTRRGARLARCSARDRCE